MKKEHKHYTRPKKPFDKETLEEERALIKKYGLKNKREIWKVEHALSRIRSQAKKLITEPEQQAVFLARLVKLGFVQPNASIDDVLALTKENLFERHLQTIVVKKGFATTQKKARQLITHRKILIDGGIVSIPSYIVRKDEEKGINLKKQRKAKEKPIEKLAEKPVEKQAEQELTEEKKTETKEEK